MLENQDVMMLNKMAEIGTKVEDVGVSVANIATKLSDTDTSAVILSLLSDDPMQNEWAFRQNGIGTILNSVYGLNSSALAGCNTVDKIATNTTAMNAILKNQYATKTCAKNLILSKKIINEDTLANGYGINIYSVGDLVQITYNGTPMNFRVVHKNYLGINKIVLLSDKVVEKNVWNSTGTNNYSTSTIREYLNSTVLQRFSQKIQNAIVAPSLPCHDYTTEKTINDKIWLPSYTEVGFSPAQSASIEGEVFDYYNDVNAATRRVKKYGDADTYWWLRTPSTGDTSGAWCVGSIGFSISYGVTGSDGVAFALII